MALTDTQKSQVRRYLGYPDVNRHHHHALEGAMDALSSEGETLAAALLVSLESVASDLESAHPRMKVVKAEDVVLAHYDEIRALRAEGQRLAMDLANLLNVRPMNTPFGGMSSTGVARRG